MSRLLSSAWRWLRPSRVAQTDSPPLPFPASGMHMPAAGIPAQGNYTPAPADPSMQYVSAGPNYYLGQYLRVLPQYIDDLTRDFGDDLYDRMLRDDMIYSSVYAFILSILADGVDVRPAIEDAKHPDYARAKEMDEFVERCIAGLSERSLEDWLEEQALACAVGYKVSEVIYEPCESGRDAGRWVLGAINAKPRRVTGLVVNAFHKVVGIRAVIPGIQPFVTTGSTVLDPSAMHNVLPIDKFVVLSWRRKDGDPRGNSILRACYDPWWEKRQVAAEYLKYLAQFAGPSVYAVLGEFAQPQDRRDENGNPTGESIAPEDALLATLLRWRNGTAAVFPYGTQLNTLFTQGTGEAFLNKLDQCDRRIARAIMLGTRTTMESQFGSRADSETSQDVTGTAIKQARKLLGHMLTNGLFRPLIRHNFGDEVARTLCPHAVLASVEHHDWAENAGAVSTLVSSGFLQPSQYAEMYQKLGLPPARPEELAALANPSTPPGGVAGPPGAVPGVPPAGATPPAATPPMPASPPGVPFSAWNESDHPRGQPDNPGQFVAGGSGTATRESGPSKSESGPEKSGSEKPAGKGGATALVEQWMEGASGTSPEQQQAYRGALEFVLGNLNDKALERVKANCLGAKFHASLEDLTQYARSLGAFIRSGQVFGGMFVTEPMAKQGMLHVDGGSEQGQAFDQRTEEIYAHEIGHAIDNGELSRKSAWSKAWKAEVAKEEAPLSKYARRSEREGFAEFHRLIVTNREAARSQFPQCWAFWDAEGLV